MSFEISNEKFQSNNEDIEMLNESNKIIQPQHRHRYRFNFNSSLPVCKPTYLKLCNINENLLLTLQNHLQNKGLENRIHGNTGHAVKRKSKVYIDYELTSSLKNFLIQYGNMYGLPSAMRHRNDSGNFVYLPTSENYTSVYENYKKHFYIEHNENDKIISYTTFCRLWHETMPNLKFQSPTSDLCEVCKNFKAKMKVEKDNNEEFEIIKKQYEEHYKAAELERQHYNNNIEKSRNDLSIAHICYDWAQNITIPYSPQQVGSIYFKIAFAIHLFGVCKTESN